MGRALRATLGLTGVALAVHAAPALASLAPLRRRLLPGLSGSGNPGHVALRPLASGVTDTGELARRGGWTLHQLRHSALTREAEDGTNTPTMLARSRHASVRSLERYARPSVDAVARHVASRDPLARRNTERTS